MKLLAALHTKTQSSFDNNPDTTMNNRTKSLIILLIIICSGNTIICAQDKYYNFSMMSQKLEFLARDYPSFCTVRSIVKTASGKDIFVITIGTGDRDNKPGIAIFGGVDGSYLLGKELVLGFAGLILKESSSGDIKKLLEKVTFYVFPDVSPDATEQFFSDIKYERNINTRSTDNDRDFVSDEDSYEDLDSDGYITLIRVRDPAGNYIESKEDKRVMIPADIADGRFGNFLVYSEGIDNDKDESFNEDGPGGVAFNNNFTYNYEEFGLNTGMHPVSEPETRAVADFLFEKFNIYTVIVFGPQDNLGQPWLSSEKMGVPQSSESEHSDRKITSIMINDEAINKLVSEKYHEITGVKGAPVIKPASGNFLEWAYYHYGRYSFGTPGWWIPVEKEMNAEVAFLQYADKNLIKDVFVPWTEIKHPDFPEKKTEVGGIKPFVMINPPTDTLGILIDKNYKFITSLASMHPELEFLDIKTENAGENIFRVSLKLHNKGIFSTCAEIGKDNMWTRIMRITFNPGTGQTILSGQKVQRVDPLDGGKSVTYSWLVNGRGSVKIAAGAINTGTITTTIELK